MKRYLLSLTTFFLSFQYCYAQQIRFTDTSNTWSVLNSTIDQCYTSYYHYNGETIINAKKYLLLDGVFVREDTLLKRVYVIPPAGETQDFSLTERILYDYNWQVGDTVRYDYPFKHFKYTITSIDSTQINSKWYKIWHFENAMSNDTFQNTTTTASYNIVEGIGSLNHPWFPVYPYTFEGYYTLSCFSENNISPEVNPAIGGFNNTTSCTLRTNVLSMRNKQIQVFPNPVNTILYFSGAQLNETKIVVTDIPGRKLISSTLQKNSIDVSSLQAGMYFYHLLYGEIQISQGTFVKE